MSGELLTMSETEQKRILVLERIKDKRYGMHSANTKADKSILFNAGHL